MNHEKSQNEKTSSNNLGGYKQADKDRMYSLQGFINKINKSEITTFGNYFVDFSEMFADQTEYQGYCLLFYFSQLLETKCVFIQRRHHGEKADQEHQLQLLPEASVLREILQ